MARSLPVLQVLSGTEALVDVNLSTAELAGLDLTSAQWSVSSQETFKSLSLPRGFAKLHRSSRQCKQ